MNNSPIESPIEQQLHEVSSQLVTETPILAGSVSGSFTTLAACRIGSLRPILLLMAHDDDADDAFATCSERCNQAHLFPALESDDQADLIAMRLGLI